uniref:disease resistance protein RGA5-like n=1 Tax=Erigeron canadensis TaxID=72917 RepID=UPI001CB9A3F4|nr:disease resistance protein RGA5-like [Erigeron canadensis]
MAKQKIVVKVTMNCEKKSRKALKIAVGLFGVESVSFDGSEKDKIVVIGEGTDPVELTKLLRKGVGYTHLVSVGPVEEKKPEVNETTNPTILPLQINPYQYCYNGYGMPYYYCYELRDFIN